MNARGFSLLELVVSTALLVLVSLAITTLATTTTAGNTKTEDRTTALTLATEKLEQLKNSSLAALAAGSDGPLKADGSSGGIYSRTWTVADDDAMLGSAAKDLTVTVAWNAGSVSVATRVVDVRQDPNGFPIAVVQSWNQVR